MDPREAELESEPTPFGTAALGADGFYVGDGNPGFRNGFASDARLLRPQGAVFDSRGYLYVADTGNSVVRRIAPNGYMTTWAGDGTAGFKDGYRTQAKFWVPADLAVDQQDNLYVTDGGNNCIRRISSDGNVSTLVNFKSALEQDGDLRAQLSPSVSGQSPSYGIAVGPDGWVYALPVAWHALVKISPAGRIQVIAGGKYVDGAGDYSPGSSFWHPDGIGGEARFRMPRYVAVDQRGDAYVGDDGIVRRVTPDGTVTSLAGSYGGSVSTGQDGVGSDANLPWIQRIACDQNDGLIVVDVKLRRVTKAGVVTTLVPHTFVDPRMPSHNLVTVTGIAVNATGGLYASDTNNNRVQRLALSQADGAQLAPP